MAIQSVKVVRRLEMAGSNSVDLAELMEHYNIAKYKLSPLFEFWKTLEQARRYVYIKCAS